jgi:hypothetical protein
MKILPFANVYNEKNFFSDAEFLTYNSFQQQQSMDTPYQRALPCGNLHSHNLYNIFDIYNKQYVRSVTFLIG